MVLKQLPIADTCFHTQVLTGYAHEIADMAWLHLQRFMGKLESQFCCELNTLLNIKAGEVYYKMDTGSATVGSEEKKTKDVVDNTYEISRDLLVAETSVLFRYTSERDEYSVPFRSLSGENRTLTEDQITKKDTLLIDLESRGDNSHFVHLRTFE